MVTSTHAPMRDLSGMHAAMALCVGVLALSVMPFFTQLNVAACGLFVVLAVWMVWHKERQLAAALSASSVFALLCTIEIGWPWPCVGASWTYAALARRWQLSEAWRNLGLPLGARAIVAMAACVAISTSVLFAWTAMAHPDVSVFRQRLPANAGWPTVLALAALFSCINAAGEELMYRGMLTDALRRAWGRPSFAMAGQAIAFGAIHWHGFPYGWWGVGLATGYGTLMAGLRLLTGGIAAPWAAHVLADMLIVILVANL